MAEASASFSDLPANQGGQHGIFKGVEFREQLVKLEDKSDVGVPESGQCFVFEPCQIDAINSDAAPVGAVQRGDHIEQRCLSCTGGTNDGDDLSSCQGNVYAPQNFEVSMAFVDAGCFEHVRKLRPKANFAAPIRPQQEHPPP